MMTPFPPKTPAQMRREAEPPARRKPAPPGKIDPAARQPLHSDTGAELDATIDWLAHIAAGRIVVR